MNRGIVAALLGFMLLSQTGSAEGRIEQFFSENNALLREDYLNAQDALEVGPEGFARHVLEYDGEGHVIREAFLDDQLLPVANKDGVITLEREYNEQGQVTRIRYLDAEGNPMPNHKLGAYGEAFEYDEAGNVSVITRLDAGGGPMIGAGGWARVEYACDGNGRRVMETCYNAVGVPCLNTGGWCRVKRQYDEAGNAVWEVYFDADLNPAPNSSGIIAILRSFNENGKVTRAMYFDGNGAPMLYARIGACGEAFEYDEAGNTIVNTRLDADAQPMIGANGWATVKNGFNEKKQKISERYFSANGEPCLMNNSYWGVDLDYDAAGNVIRETYYDLSGSVGANGDGIIITEKSYNKAGKVAFQRFLDAGGNPMPVGGRYQVAMEYDGRNHLTRETNLDTDFNRILGAEGWCQHDITPDEHNWRLTERYSDTDGMPVLLNGDYSGIDRAFNESGRVIRETFHDATGDIGPNKAGIIVRETDYDNAGRIVELRYYDGMGAPMIPAGIGAHIERRAYDEAGNLNYTGYFDAGGDPMKGPEGWAWAQYEYDEANQRIAERYYDELGEAVS